MHYYQFHIGDYRKDTSHLTPIEHYIYRSLIDWYYLDEKPIPSITHSVIRRLGLVIDYTVNVENVLADFFILHDDGYHHGRIDKELEHYHVVCLKNKDNGIKGGRPRKTHSVTTGNPNVTQNNPDVTLTNNQEPRTNNHKPIKNNTTAILASLGVDETIAADWIALRKTKKAAVTPPVPVNTNESAAIKSKKVVASATKLNASAVKLNASAVKLNASAAKLNVSATQ